MNYNSQNKNKNNNKKKGKIERVHYKTTIVLNKDRIQKHKIWTDNFDNHKPSFEYNL